MKVSKCANFTGGNKSAGPFKAPSSRGTPLEGRDAQSYKNQRKSSTAGPSLNKAVGISLTSIFRPAFLSRRRLSAIIQKPSASVMQNPVPPNAAVVANAGIYFGASWFRKMLLLTTPIRFAIGTPKEVSTRRRPSCAILLLYHTSRSTEGAEVPQVIMNAAKYATWSWCTTSMEAKIMKPMKVNRKPAAMKGKRQR